KRLSRTGWLGRAAAEGTDRASGGVPILNIGGRQPLAVAGAPGGAVSITNSNSFRLEMGEDASRQGDRRKLLEGASAPPKAPGEDDLLSFVQRRQVQTMTAVEQLRDLLEGPNAIRGYGGGLQQKLQLVAGLIARGFGTRIFYVSIDGFDTHADQETTHKRILGE